MSLQHRGLLNMLGLAARARRVVAGTEQVRSAVRKGRVHEVLLAVDSSPGQRGKLVPLLVARGVDFRILLSREELGAAIGRAPVSAVAITDWHIAQRVNELAAALPDANDQAEERE